MRDNSEQIINHMELSDIIINRWVKSKLPRNSALADVCWYLRKHDSRKQHDDLLVRERLRNVPPSFFQDKLYASHKIKPEDGYKVEKCGNDYIVTPPEGSYTYTLSPNPRSVCISKEECLCICVHCDSGHCAHRFTCSCESFGRHQVCKHIHLLVDDEDLDEDREEEESGHDTEQVTRDFEVVPPGHDYIHTVEVADSATVTISNPQGSATVSLSNPQDDILSEEEDIEELMNVPEGTGGTEDRCQDVEISAENFNFIQRNTLNCMTRAANLRNEVKNLEATNDGIKRLKHIRNKRLFEFRQESYLLTASGDTKHRKQSKGFPGQGKKKSKQGNITKVNTRRAKTGTNPDTTKSTKQLIEEGLSNLVSEDCWGRLTHFPDMMYLRSLLAHYPEEEREQFLSKIKPAQSLWACNECETYEADKYDGNYVRCDECEEWAHFKCTGLDEMPEEEEKWKCSKCGDVDQE